MDAVKQAVIVICGVKNSGKTTLITSLIPKLAEQGLQVAAIKHDGHEFESDVPGTDSYKLQKAGAYGTAVYSGTQFMLMKKEAGIKLETLVSFFPEADVILVEGCKDSTYPKIEVIRTINGNEPVSNPEGRFLIVTDKEDGGCGEPWEPFSNIDGIVKAVMEQIDVSVRQERI